MAIIYNFIVICFFAALAASGFITTVQILYWLGNISISVIAISNIINAVEGIDRIKNKKPLSKDIEIIVPILYTMNYDVKCVHAFFANAIHAYIAFSLLSSPLLAAFIIISACFWIVSMLKLKEMMKYVKNDSRYQQ